MDRKITFRKVEAGHYVNDETGVEVSKVPARRLGRNGWRVAGWAVTAPVFSNGHLSRSEVGFETTLAAARKPAAQIAQATRAQAAADYVEAATEDVDRAARQVREAVLAIADDETEWMRDKIASARASLLRGDSDRARAFARIAADAAREQVADLALPDGRFTRQAHEVATERSGAAPDAEWAPMVVGRGYYRINAQGHFNAAYHHTGDVQSALNMLHEEAIDMNVAYAVRHARLMREEEWQRSPKRQRYVLLAERDAYTEAAWRAGLTVDDRAYLHPAYSEARATRSHQAAMIAGQAAVEAEDRALTAPGAGGLAARVDEIRQAMWDGVTSARSASLLLMAEMGVTREGALALLNAPSTASLA